MGVMTHTIEEKLLFYSYFILRLETLKDSNNI